MTRPPPKPTHLPHIPEQVIGRSPRSSEVIDVSRILQMRMEAGPGLPPGTTILVYVEQGERLVSRAEWFGWRYVVDIDTLWEFWEKRETVDDAWTRVADAVVRLKLRAELCTLMARAAEAGRTAVRP